MPGIIVGVDGPGHSRPALAWAMREAALRHVPLAVMTVRPPAVRPATRIYWPVPDVPETGTSLELEEKAVWEFADTVASEIGEPVPEITVRVATGAAAEELIKASREASLLVVGARGRGGFAGLVMGSVSSQVMHHAACPVVIVPAAR